MRNILRRFFELESSGGIVLFFMALLAMVWANSPYDYIHKQFTGAFLFWINEGLMAVFFLLVGLELKRAYVGGQFSGRSQIILPFAGALGGMLVPALIYILFNYSSPIKLVGWATPVATDIAFALGVLSLFGKRISYSAKLFLLLLAIFDDLGAIVIIAVFYSKSIAYIYLFQGLVLVLLLALFNRIKIYSLWPYMLVGTWLWFVLLHSGIHPTIAGFILALTIPDHADSNISPLFRLEHNLNPWVAYFIMPVFALANAGVSLKGLEPSVLLDSLVLGIVCGLFFGKQIGVFLVTWLLSKLKSIPSLHGTSTLELYGVSLLCGIGFTMSLFLGTLSFQHAGDIFLTEVRIGVLLGSLLSGLAGSFALWLAVKRKTEAAT